MKTFLASMMAVVGLAALASPVAAQHRTTYGYQTPYYAPYQVHREVFTYTASTYVYDYPKVDYVVVPAYQLAPAVAIQPAALPAAVTTGTPATPEVVQPVAGNGPVPTVVYLKPAQAYTVEYVPVYRTRPACYK